MKVGITKEIYPGECRVAATPETARRLIEKLGFEVLVESDAGAAASFPDDGYQAVGCEVTMIRRRFGQRADIVLKVRGPQEHEVQQMRDGQTLDLLFGPRTKRRVARKDRGQERDRVVDRCGTAYQPGTKTGCAQLDGQHRRLSRGRRSGRCSVDSLPVKSPRPEKCRQPKCW